MILWYPGVSRAAKMERAHRVASELLSTEEQYVSILHLIDQVGLEIRAYEISRPCSFNLGFCVGHSKVASGTPFVGHLWTDLAETWVGF